MTPKQQAFVEEYAKDRNGKQAAIRAGYAPGAAEVTASRLLSNVKVRAALNTLLAACAEKTQMSVASVTTRLLTIADKAEELDSAPGMNVARQALMDAAKLNGLVVETSETIVRTPEERAARLAFLRAERERVARAH